MRRWRAVLVGAIAVVGAGRQGRASVIASDAFAYPTGSVAGQTGGTGWAGGWTTGQSAAFVVGPALGTSLGIGETGGALQVTGSGRVFRKLDLAAGSPAATAGLVASHTAMFFGTIDGIGVPGTTVWVGMIVSGGSANAGDETQYHLYDGARTDATSLALGDQNKDGEAVAMLRGGNVAQWGFERTCGHSACTAGTAAGYFATNPVVGFGGTHWSVTRFVFGATTTEITMWRDPAPGATDPADASALVLTPFGGGTAAQRIVVPAMFFDTIAPNASGNFNYVVDEIRIATTFAELGGGGTTVGNDAGAVDAGTVMADGGATADGGASDAALAAGDAAPNAETGAAHGCGCAASGGSSAGELVGGLSVLAIVLRRRRREPTRASISAAAED